MSLLLLNNRKKFSGGVTIYQPSDLDNLRVWHKADGMVFDGSNILTAWNDSSANGLNYTLTAGNPGKGSIDSINAVDLEANSSASVRSASDAVFNMSSLTYVVLIQVESLDATFLRMIEQQLGADNNNILVQLGILNITGFPRVLVRDVSGNVINCAGDEATVGATIIAFTLDAPNKTITLYYNGKKFTATNASYTETTVFSGGSSANFGAYWNGSGFSNFFDGLIAWRSAHSGVKTIQEINGLAAGVKVNYPSAVWSPITE